MFRWVPTNARMAIMGHAPTSVCPLCNEAKETIDHVLQCPCHTATRGRDIALVTLEETLDLCHTHPSLVKLFTRAVYTDSAPDWAHTAECPIIAKMIENQLRIGWHLVKFGVLSFEWKNAQHNWAQQFVPDFGTNKLKQWTKKFQ